MKRVLLFNSESEADEQVPEGAIRAVNVKGSRLCITRSGGRYYAIEDSCPHMSVRLTNGHLNALGEIVCPWHGYRYSLRTGEEIAKRCGDLKKVKIVQVGEKCYLEF